MSRQVAQQEGNQVSNSVSQAAQSTAAQAQAEAVATCPTQGAAGIISCYLMVPGTTQNNAPPQYTVQSVPLTNTGGICLTYADVWCGPQPPDCCCDTPRPSLARVRAVNL